MRKIRNSLILILTVAIIAFCAILPRIYADMQDSVSDEKVEYEDIKTVLFEKDLYFVEKLFLLRDGLRVSVSEESTSKTSEEILDHAYGWLEYFFSYGMLGSDWNSYKIKMEPMLFFYDDLDNISSTFWLVEFVLEDDWGVISLWLDDETGKMLSINYDSQYQIYNQYELEEYLSAFCSFYLDQNNVWKDQEITQEYTDITDVAANQSYTTDEFNDKKNGTAMVFTIGDKIYGELNLYFYIYTNGFFLSLS